MSQSFYSPQYGSNNQEYIESLVSKEVKKYTEQGKVQNAMYNPRTGYIHVTSENVDSVSNEMWANWPKVANYEEYKKLKALNASGQKNTESGSI